MGWDPGRDIANNEIIGRRLYDRKSLKGASDQKVPEDAVELYHFEDTRGDISMDRLGVGCINNDVVLHLEPKAISNAEKILRSFRGWATVGANKISKSWDGPEKITIKLIASPIIASEKHLDNLYHCHTEFSEKDEQGDLRSAKKLISLFVAAHLHAVFSKNPKIQKSSSGKD